MKTYIGTKIVKAESMSKGDYYKEKEKKELNGNPPTLLQAMSVTSIEGHPTDEGYKVEYEDGYISWSPKEVFEKAYVLIDTHLIDLVEKVIDGADFDVREKVWAAARLGVQFSNKVRYGVLPTTLKYYGNTSEVDIQKFKENWERSIRNIQPEMQLCTFKEKGRYVVAMCCRRGAEPLNVYVDIEILPEDTAETIHKKIRLEVRKQPEFYSIQSITKL